MANERQVWELRIHGVNNTPPGSMLETCGDLPPTPGTSRLPVLVAGDDTTGFYRYLPPAPGDPRFVVEAFSWGQLTSGRRGAANGVVNDVRRAAWSLVLPFALVNVALWARPSVTPEPGDRGDAPAWWLAGLVRLMAVSLTVTLTVAAAGAGLDLFAWQCEARCASTPPGLGRARSLDPAHLVAVAAAVPLALILGLAWISGKTFQYEAVTPARRQRSASVRVHHPFEHPDFWSGGSQVKALRRLHLAAAFAAVAHLLAASVWAAPAPDRFWRPAGWGVSILALVVLLAVVSGLFRHGRLAARRSVAPGSRPPTARWLPWLAVALVVAGGVVAWNGPGPAEGTRLPGYESTLRWLFLGQFAVLIACLCTNRRAARRARGAAEEDPQAENRPAWRGLGTTLFTGGGWALGLLYSAAVLFGVTWYLNRGPAVPHVALVTPTLRWAAAALVVGVALLSVAVVTGWRVFDDERRTGTAAALADAGIDPQDATPHERFAAGVAGRWRALHRIDGYRALRWAGLLSAAVLALITAGAAVAVTNIVEGYHQRAALHWAYSPGDDRPAGHPEWHDVDLLWMSDTGALVAVGLLLGLVALLGAAYRSATVRRVVGVVWDVTTFWPRGAHPFAPPCYAEAAVPMLITRVTAEQAKPDTGPVLLAGHSQGAVIATACIFQLENRGNVHLFTFGTQLSRFYGRAFPAFFGWESRRRLREILDNGNGPVKFPPRPYRWTSFYRRTDPLGWPVGTDAEPDPDIDELVRDPDGLEPEGGEVLDPPVRQHRGYPLSQEYEDARDQLARTFLSGP